MEEIDKIRCSKLEELQQSAINNVISRILDANEATKTTRIGELHNLHIAASMNIEKTTESLNHILRYKKEIARQMLLCSNEKQMNIIAELIIQADNMIKEILGIYTP